MHKKTINESAFPALYQAADHASMDAQSKYYWALRSYLILLVIAAFVSFCWPKDTYGALVSAALFLVTLSILIWLKVQKPEDTWYNGRSVAESVRTRTWRWVMKAEPYHQDISDEQLEKAFISDLKSILTQNQSLCSSFVWTPHLGGAISEEMKNVRGLPLPERLNVYTKDRIDDQSAWYSKKSQFNKQRATQWFVVSVSLHAMAVIMLMYRIKDPTVSFPIEVVATSATAVLTWLQTKKHNELKASYTLTAHEIVLIKSESVSVKTEQQLSDFVVNSETAFSREHTQWAAKKNM